MALGPCLKLTWLVSMGILQEYNTVRLILQNVLCKLRTDTGKIIEINYFLVLHSNCRFILSEVEVTRLLNSVLVFLYFCDRNERSNLQE